MRIRTDSAASAASLAEYLQRCECIVEVIDHQIIDATARPRSFAAPHAHVELEGYLTVWQAMHPESLIERLTADFQLSALRAVEDELIVPVGVGTPAILVLRQRDLQALRALRDSCDLLRRLQKLSNKRLID
jgi:hypothetical protein